jgi:hypothetical protein
MYQPTNLGQISLIDYIAFTTGAVGIGESNTARLFQSYGGVETYVMLSKYASFVSMMGTELAATPKHYFPSVWIYEVVEQYGYEVALYLITHKDEGEKEICAMLGPILAEYYHSASDTELVETVAGIIAKHTNYDIIKKERNSDNA